MNYILHSAVGISRLNTLNLYRVLSHTQDVRSSMVFKENKKKPKKKACEV